MFSISSCLSRSVEIPDELTPANLLSVSIRMLKKGVPQSRAEICLPTEEDISTVKLDINSCGPAIQAYNGKCKRDKDTHCVLAEDRLKPSREVVGYVTDGGYSLEKGMACGRGFITLKSWLNGLGSNNRRLSTSQSSSEGLLCLVRAHDSVQYRFALLNILRPRYDH